MVMTDIKKSEKMEKSLKNNEVVEIIDKMILITESLKNEVKAYTVIEKEGEIEKANKKHQSKKENNQSKKENNIGLVKAEEAGTTTAALDKKENNIDPTKSDNTGKEIKQNKGGRSL